MLKIDRTLAVLDIDVGIEPGFDFLSDEYRRLFDSIGGAAFQAPLWMHMIHKRLAPPLGATQQTLTVRDRQSGALLAVVPLVLQKARGVTLLQPADFGVCDYNQPVASTQTLEALAGNRAVLDAFDAATRNADIFLFRKSRRDAFDIGRLFRSTQPSAAENAGYHSDIDEDFDLWRRRTVRRQFSKELGRLGRQIATDHGHYETRAATGKDEITRAFDFLRASRAGRFDDDLLANDIYFEFYRDYAVAAAATSEAVTYVSWLDGEPVAVLFGVQGDGDFHAVQLAYDGATLGKYSLGLQIIYRTIKLRHEQGFRHFDMGLGNSGYKSHFRVDETDLNNYSRSNSLRGAAVNYIYTRAKPLKNILKRLTPVR